MTSHQYYMSIALEEARKAAKKGKCQLVLSLLKMEKL